MLTIFRTLSFEEKEEMMLESCKSDSSFETVKKLLDDDNFPPNQLIRSQETGSHWTPLTLSCFHGSEKIASLLISRGAMIDKGNKFGDTPLSMASLKKQKSIVSLLIKKGASINASNCDGDTALYTACQRGHVSIVRELLNCGADLEKREKINGWKPLEAACYCGRGEVFVEIFKHLADKLSRDDFKSALNEATKWFEIGWGELPLSSFLCEDVMESLEYSLSTNRENNEKGAR